MRTQTVSPGDGQGRPGLVKVEMQGAGAASAVKAGSVALRFDDGSGTVIAALKDFIANVVVDDGRVVNVSYLPSRAHFLWSTYNQERTRLENLHAVVATRTGLKTTPGRHDPKPRMRS